MPQLFPVPVVHHGARHFHIILIGARLQGVGIFLQLFRAGHVFCPGEVEQGIAVVEQRSRGDDPIGSVVDQKAEIAEVPVGIVYNGIKHDHIPQGLEILRALLLVERPHGVKSAMRHQASDGHKGDILAGKQVAGGAKLTLPLGEAVADGVDAHGFGDLGSIVFRIRFVAGIGCAGGAAFIQLHFAIYPAPALGQHAVGGELRAGIQGGPPAAAVAGERDQAEHAAEPVLVQVVPVERAVEAVLHDPIAVVQGQALADSDDGHGAIDVQAAPGQQRVDIGAVLRDSAPLNPPAQAFRGRREIEGKQSLLFLIDPFDPQLRRCRVFNDAEPQQRDIELLQYVAHARTSLRIDYLYSIRNRVVFQG